MTVLGEALKQLRQEYVSAGKTSTFEALKAFLDPNNSVPPPSYDELIEGVVLLGRRHVEQIQPLPGVTITVINHPEFGQTLSRADGMFDLVVNGGGPPTGSDLQWACVGHDILTVALGAG